MATAFCFMFSTGRLRVYPRELAGFAFRLSFRSRAAMRKFSTLDEKQVLQAGAGALQDLGFTIEKVNRN